MSDQVGAGAVGEAGPLGTDPGETEEEAAIVAELRRLSEVREAIRERQLALHARLGAIAAEKTVARMSDSERAAIAQVIALKGVESGEAVG